MNKQILFACLFLLPIRSIGQEPSTKDATVILVHPAVEPRPALKFRLTPPGHTQRHGNAALFYHRAIQLLSTFKQQEIRSVQAGTDKQERPRPFDDEFTDWLVLPLEEFPSEQIRNKLQRVEHILKEIELGSQRADCDWGLTTRQEGLDLSLPEIQETRSLARLVAVKARLEIQEHRPDQAMRWIQVGGALGRHVSHGPTMIQALVGLAIDHIMVDRIVEWIQMPGTPSLYWALADRPRPFVSLEPAVEGEYYLLERILPRLTELDRRIWSVEETRTFIADLEKEARAFAPDDLYPFASFVGNRLSLAMIAADRYPDARKALIAEGHDPDRLDAMPIVQVSLLHAYEGFKQNRDQRIKWFNMPYWQSYNRIDGPVPSSSPENPTSRLLTLLEYSIPASGFTRLGSVRLERRYDALQCVEAIRLYAGTHKGQFPERLEDLVESPCPSDPALGIPFRYRVEGKTARVEGDRIPDSPERHEYQIQYLLKMAN